MNYNHKYALETAKEIVIAKLSTSAPNSSNKEAGEHIGEMYEAIYKKVLEVCSCTEPK